MKTQTLSRFSFPAVLVIAALALTGCSSDDGNKKQAEEVGPLQKYMSALWGSAEESQELHIKQQAQTEELIAKCMTKEGFEYQPNTLTDEVPMTSDEKDDGPERGSLEFAETYGYGLGDLGSMPGTGGGRQSVEILNTDGITSRPQAEQHAYYETLYGAGYGHGPEEGDEDVMEEYDWRTAGCSGAAQREVQGNSADVYLDPDFTALFDQMDEMNSEIYGDGENGSNNEELAKIDRRWSECMAESGYDFPNPIGAENALTEVWNETQSTGGSDSGEYKEAKKELQEKEIETAVADAKCKEKDNYQDEQFKARNKIEQKFVDEHRADLDAMVSQYGSQKKDK